MKFLTVVTPHTIYHCLSTLKKFWEDKFTPVNIKSCGRQNVIKQKEIMNGEQYIALKFI